MDEKTEAQIAVAYVGLKASETDHLYGTGITWVGKDDVQLVPASAWDKMKKHADVWREVTAAEQEQAVEEVPADIAYALSDAHSKALRAEEAVTAEIPQSEPKQETAAPTGKTAAALAKRFSRMDDDEVRAYVKAAGKSLHHKLTGDNLRSKALELLAED